MSETPQVILIGANGMLGQAWRNTLDAQAVPYHAADRSTLDITDVDAIWKIIGPDTRVVINCAAFTGVDASETQEELATAINGTAVARLAERCAQSGATLVHYSTDYVFDGTADSPYPTDAPRNPISAYGRSKAAGELAVLDSGCDHRLIRTSWLYAPWGKNFVHTMLRLTREKDTLKVVNDQSGRPSSAQHVADASWRLVNEAQSGIYHLADAGDCTWYDFAREVARLAGNDCDITPCPTSDFPLPAKRPAYSILDLGDTESILGPIDHWKTSLAHVIQRIQTTSAPDPQPSTP